MGCFQVDGRCHSMFQGGFPASDTNTPFIPGFKSGKIPLWPGRHQIVSVKHGEIEKFASSLDTHGVQTGIPRAGAAIAVAIKSGEWIAAATFQFRSKHIGWHRASLRRSGQVRKGKPGAGCAFAPPKGPPT
jgi:hypothetical protein